MRLARRDGRSLPWAFFPMFATGGHGPLEKKTWATYVVFSAGCHVQAMDTL